jgi:hypothetical protein
MSDVGKPDCSLSKELTARQTFRVNWRIFKRDHERFNGTAPQLLGKKPG